MSQSSMPVETAIPAVATRRWPRAIAHEFTRAKVPLLFILPAVIFAAVFLYYPAFSGLYHAFFDWDGVSRPDFIGLANFQEMMGDDVVHTAAINVAKLTAAGFVLALTVPLFVAKLINSMRNPRVQYLLRVGFVVPLVVPTIVLFLIWGFFYEPTAGLLNRLLVDLHQKGLTQAWLGDPKTALYSIIFMGFPWVDGFGLLIYTAGLHAIPVELPEAAAIDGANGWHRFWRIEVPLILGQIRLMGTLAIINGLQNFTAILILTQGGPGQATTVPGLYLYQAAIYDQRMGYASAIALVLFVIILLLTVANMKFIRPATEFEGATVK